VTQRMYVVPDLGDDLNGALGLVDVALTQLAGRLAHPPPTWPAALRDRGGVEALDRVYAAIRTTQGAGWKRWMAPNGRDEHVPLRFVFLREEDLAALAAVAMELGRALHARVAPGLRDALESAADAAGTTPLELVNTLTRVHGLIDLPLTDDANVLHDASVRARDGKSRHRSGTGDLVLKRHEEKAYQAMVGVLYARWALTNPLVSDLMLERSRPQWKRT